MEYNLYRTDWTGFPSQSLKNDKKTILKEHIRSGDLLVIKNKKDVNKLLYRYIVDN